MDNEEKILDEKEKSKVTGLGIGVGFLTVGMVLLYNVDYFGNDIVSEIVILLCIGFGILGIGVESQEKGGFELAFGIVCIAAWWYLYKIFDLFIIRILGVILLGFGSGVFYIGLFTMMYIICIDMKKGRKEKSSINIIVAISQMVGMITAILQLLFLIKSNI